MHFYRSFKKTAVILFVGILLILGGCGENKPKATEVDAPKWTVGDFSYIDHNGDPFYLANLEGKVWLADFIFTNCKTVCLPMTSNMTKIQQQLKAEGLDVEIVSFTVDPKVDNPAILKEYGEKFEADLSSWHFLTGYTQEEIETFARESFRTLVQEDPSSDQVIHGITFFLVNQAGEVVKTYDGVQPPIEDIIADAKALLKK